MVMVMVMVMMVVIVNPFLLNKPVLDLISSETDVLSIIMSYHGTYHKPGLSWGMGNWGYKWGCLYTLWDRTMGGMNILSRCRTPKVCLWPNRNGLQIPCLLQFLWLHLYERAARRCQPLNWWVTYNDSIFLCISMCFFVGIIYSFVFLVVFLIFRCKIHSPAPVQICWTWSLAFDHVTEVIRQFQAGSLQGRFFLSFRWFSPRAVNCCCCCCCCCCYPKLLWMSIIFGGWKGNIISERPCAQIHRQYDEKHIKAAGFLFVFPVFGRFWCFYSLCVADIRIWWLWIRIVFPDQFGSVHRGRTDCQQLGYEANFCSTRGKRCGSPSTQLKRKSMKKNKNASNSTWHIALSHL